MPAPKPSSPPPARLPGARTSCALLTLATVLLAWPDPPAAFASLVRPGYFALLTWFFWRTGRASPALHTQAMRLVTGGFFVLWLGFTTVAAIHFAGLEPVHGSFVYLRNACERGAWFLLGTTLIAYGLMLWIPRVVQSHQVLAAASLRQQGQLLREQSARSELEQRLVEADRRGMLGELAASIAHDLRNPLTVVKGTAEALCRRPRTPAEIAQHTDVIRRNIEKADHTIAALIDLARPRAVARAALSARGAFAEVEELLRVEARRRGVELTVAPATVADPTVCADRTLLAQALLNLVLNALQATAPGGTIRLRARPWTGQRVALAIDDRGSGLPPEVRERLFTPFFTTKPNGTGLGLPSCRRIVNELGGDLRLYPRHRGGARALLLLPGGDALSRDPAPADERSRWPVCTS